MLLATIAMLPPAIARWVLLLGLGPQVVFAVATLLLVPIVAWDLKTRRRLHAVTLWGGLLLIVSGHCVWRWRRPMAGSSSPTGWWAW